MKAPHGQSRPSPIYLVSRAQACITGRDFSACSFTPEPAKPVPPCRRRGCRGGSLAEEVKLGPGPWLDGGGGSGRRVATHPLQHDDVAVRELIPGHWVHHVLANQLLHALQGDNGPTAVRVRVGGEESGHCPRKGATPAPAVSGRSPGCPLGDSRGAQHGAGRGVAQAVAGHGAHVALAACDEPHAVHGAVQRREAHRRQVGHAQRLPGHGAGHDARLGWGREAGSAGGAGAGWGENREGAFRTQVWEGAGCEPGPLWQRGHKGACWGRGSPASPASWPLPRGSVTGSRSWAALCPCPCLRGPHWTRVGHRLRWGGPGMLHPRRHLWDPPPTCRLISLSHLGRSLPRRPWA